MGEFYNTTTVEPEWGAMLSLAKAYFESSNQKEYKYHQCLVLTLANSEHIVCPSAANSVDSLKSEACSYIEGLLKEHNNHTIKKVICMWENNTIDVPSSDFMKRICEINKENRNAIVLLNAGMDIYIAKKIVDII